MKCVVVIVCLRFVLGSLFTAPTFALHLGIVSIIMFAILFPLYKIRWFSQMPLGFTMFCVHVSSRKVDESFTDWIKAIGLSERTNKTD